MSIVAEILENLKSSFHLSELEERLELLMQEYLTSHLAFCLEQLDKEIIRPHLAAGWSIDRLESRQLTFSFGTVTFKRRRLKKAGEKSFLPLDESLGIVQHQRFSPGFQEKISQLATGMTFRKASESLELLTGISMSHQTVHHICQEVAEKIKQTDLVEPLEKQTPEVLYVEADGVWIGSQEKRKHHEFKRGCIHEGVRQRGNRRELINPVYFGTFETSSDLFERISDYALAHYDLRNSVIIANSDGGSGYEAGKFEDCFGQSKSFHYCLDSYHVMRQITAKLGFAKATQVALRKAVKAYDYEQVVLQLDTLESQLEDEKQLKCLNQLRSYLTCNWAGIKPISMRNLGVTSGVGICESGHRYYTNRLKKQGRNWTREGAENMAILLTAFRNGDFKERYRSELTCQAFTEDVTVSMRAVLKKFQHEAHTISQARIPVYAASSSPIGRLAKGFRT